MKSREDHPIHPTRANMPDGDVAKQLAKLSGHSPKGSAFGEIKPRTGSAKPKGK